MSPQLVRIAFAILLLGHGLGHALTAFPLFGIRLSDSHSTGSWALGRGLADGPVSGLCVAVNLLALLAFAGAGLAMGGWGVPRGAWERLALLGGIVSSLGLVLFWDAFPFLFPNRIGVMVVNVWAISSVLWLRWPAGLFDG